MRELHKQIEQKEKEMEDYSFQYNNSKEQLKLYESTINEQKVSVILGSDHHSFPRIY